MSILGVSLFTEDLLINYDVPLDDSDNFTQIFNLTAEINQIVPEIENTTLEGKVSVADLFVTISQGALTTMKIVATTPTIIHNMLLASLTAIGVPSVFAWFIYLILTVWVSFAIVSAIFKWKT
jgi:hypothetical protein